MNIDEDMYVRATAYWFSNRYREFQQMYYVSGIQESAMQDEISLYFSRINIPWLESKMVIEFYT